MLLSVPICSIIYSIVRTNVNDKIDKKNTEKIKIEQKKKREKDIEHQQTPYAYKSVACQRHLR